MSSSSTGPPSIIDSDVHHTWASSTELQDYLPASWREFVRESTPEFRPPTLMYPQIGGVNKRVDSFGPNGELPGAVRETMREQLLDPFNVEAAVLTYDIGNEANHHNPHFSAAIASAANDWTLDHWLTDDEPRLYSAVLCGTQLPEQAAREIRRVGPHPRMVSVLMCSNGLGLPFGHPTFDPIYAAAVELGLPVSIHVGNEVHRVTHYTAAGMPSSRLEAHSTLMQPVQHYLTSLITYGVFERFPELKVVIVEAGVSWLPWFLLRLDAMEAQLRRESPWVKRTPSDYVREHVRFTTQPFDAGPNRAGLISMLEGVGGIEDLLMFSSDYPHWDADDPLYLTRMVPAAWRDKILRENARKLYGLPARPAAAEAVA